MATKVSCCNIWLTPFDSLTPKTPYQTQTSKRYLLYKPSYSRSCPKFRCHGNGVGCCKIWLTLFDSLTPKTPYQTQQANYSFKRQYLANGRRYVQSYYYWLIESWIALLTDTKTDDLELHKFEFLPNLTWFRRFSYAKNGYTNEYRPMSATSHWQYGLSTFV